MKLVSAILTTCRREPAIVERALNSIAAQTYPNIEIIVVDDSPDDFPLRGEIKRLTERVADVSGREAAYIPHERNSGACAARNTGIKAAHGSVIAFLDDDDEWLPEKTEHMLPLLDNGAALAYCGSVTVNDDDGSEELLPHAEHHGRVFGALIMDNFIGSTSFPLIDRAALEKTGGFDTEMRSAQDYDLWLRLAKDNDFECTMECLTRYHVHSGTRISTNADNRIAGLERLNMKNAEYLASHPDAAWIRGMKLVPHYRVRYGANRALSQWARCVRKKPLNILGNLKYLGKALIRC